MLHPSRMILRLVCFAALIAPLTACDSPITATEEEAPLALESAASPQNAQAHARRSVRRQLASLRRYARPFRTIAKGTAAGFDVQVTECRDNPPVGGMGYHFANLSRIDGEAPTVLEPEILVYIPTKNGHERLGAVEYIVPFALWEGSPPELFGQEFVANEADGVWQLHVWLFRHNPAGLFADWNPAVSCN